MVAEARVARGGMTLGAKRGGVVALGLLSSQAALLLTVWSPVVAGVGVIVTGVGTVVALRRLPDPNGEGMWWARIATAFVYMGAVVRIGDPRRDVPIWVQVVVFAALLWIVKVSTSGPRTGTA